MRDYYDELWERLPADQTPWRFRARRAFLLGELRPGDRLLDLGCGEGQFSAAAAAAGAVVTAADVAPEALRRLHTRHPELTTVQVPFDGPLPFEDGQFDIVWAGEVIEHVADTARWLSEVRRVLTPHGRLLVTTPNHGRLPLLIHGIEDLAPPLGDHLHLYDAGGLRRLLEEFGFADVHVARAGGLPLLRHALHARAARNSRARSRVQE